MRYLGTIRGHLGLKKSQDGKLAYDLVHKKEQRSELTTK